MEQNSQFPRKSGDTYSLMLISVVAACIIASAAIWIWYAYQDAQLENALLHIK